GLREDANVVRHYVFGISPLRRVKPSKYHVDELINVAMGSLNRTMSSRSERLTTILAADLVCLPTHTSKVMIQWYNDRDLLNNSRCYKSYKELRVVSSQKQHKSLLCMEYMWLWKKFKKLYFKETLDVKVDGLRFKPIGCTRDGFHLLDVKGKRVTVRWKRSEWVYNIRFELEVLATGSVSYGPVDTSGGFTTSCAESSHELTSMLGMTTRGVKTNLTEICFNKLVLSVRPAIQSTKARNNGSHFQFNFIYPLRQRVSYVRFISSGGRRISYVQFISFDGKMVHVVRFISSGGRTVVSSSPSVKDGTCCSVHLSRRRT
nr:hypothetical protein [Tanacetum cinerariifolium]